MPGTIPDEPIEMEMKTPAKLIFTHCLLIVALLLWAVPAAISQTVAEITVDAGAYDRMDVPVLVPLKGIVINQPGKELRLVETTSGDEIVVTSQLKAGNPLQLAWILDGDTPAGVVRRFELRLVEVMEHGEASSTSLVMDSDEAINSGVVISDNGDDLEITLDGRPVFNYRYTAMPVPEGVSETYSRGGFIHPLWTPGGQIVTRIQAPGDRHHYGVWNPWTQVSYRGREEPYDFWNIGSNNPDYRQRGTIRSEGILERISGEVFGGFRSELNYLVRDLPHNVSLEDEVALIEQVEVDVWNTGSENDIWLIDYTSTYNPPADNDFRVITFRYQGFSLRTTELWTEENATLLTSAGYEQSNGNGTRARWVNVEGASVAPDGKSGVLMMTNPVNFDYPEHIRIWPSGELFVNFNPAYYEPPPGSTEPGVATDLIEYGKTTTLRYRMMLYDGELSIEEAERYWQDFAYPPLVDVTPVSEL